MPPMHLDQCKFYFDAQQNPVAFVTWSNITEATKTKLVGTRRPNGMGMTGTAAPYYCLTTL